MHGPRRACGAPHGQEPPHRRVARQGQDDQQVPRQGLHRPGVLRPRPRPDPQGGRGRPRQRFRDVVRDHRAQRETRRRDRQGRQGRRAPVPGDRPGPRRRGDQLAHRRDPARARPAQGPHVAARGVHRDHPARHQGGDGPSARDRDRPRRRPAGAPRAGLPGRFQPVTGAVAQGPARPVRRPRAVAGAAHDRRARGGDRGVHRPRVLVDRGRVPAPVAGIHRAPDQARWREVPAIHGHRRRHRRSRAQTHRGCRQRRAAGHRRGQQGAQAPPGCAVHDLHAPAGGRAQARLHHQAHHAGRAEVVRGRRDRRRGRHRRPDQLHAYRLGSAVSRGAIGDPRRDRARLRYPCAARPAQRLQDQVQERPGSPRGGAPDLGVAHALAGIALPGGRRAPAVRADLETRRRIPNGPGHAQHRVGRPRRRQRAQLPRLRHDRDRPRLPGRVRGRQGRQDRRRGRRGPQASGDEDRRPHPDRAHPQRPALHRAAAALLGSLAGQDARGIRHRPAVDVRVDHRHPAVPQVRRTRQPPLPSQRCRPRGQQLPQRPLHPVRRLRLHRQARGRTRCGVSWRRGLGAVDGTLLGAVQADGRRKDGVGRPQRGHRRARARHRPQIRQAGQRAPRSLRAVCGDRQHRRGRRGEADVRLAAAGPEHAHDRAGRCAGAVQAAAQARPRQGRGSQRRHRPFRRVRQARQRVCVAEERRRPVHDRPRVRGGPDRGKGRDRAQPHHQELRRQRHPGAQRPLRPVHQRRQAQRPNPQGPRAGVVHA